MQLERFNKQNRISSRDQTPTVSFSASGLISINTPAMQAIGLAENDCVEMLYDAKEKQWYIAKTDEETGLQVRLLKAKYYGISHAACTHKVMEEFEKTAKSTLKGLVSNARVQHEGQELVSLIMKRKSPVNK